MITASSLNRYICVVPAQTTHGDNIGSLAGVGFTPEEAFEECTHTCENLGYFKPTIEECTIFNGPAREYEARVVTTTITTTEFQEVWQNETSNGCA